MGAVPMHRLYNKISIVITSLIAYFWLASTQLNFLSHQINSDNKISFTVKFTLSPNEYVYYDNLYLSSNSSAYTIVSWQGNQQPEELFDPLLRIL
jgi:hypothetical protein